MRRELLIYGVTGCCGGLASSHAAESGWPHIAAGRDLEFVAAHADRWMLPARAFSLLDPARIDRALQGVAVVLNAAAASPEEALGLAAACLRGGIHYLDLDGGVERVAALQNLDARAREAGSMLMAGVGVAVVPSDALAARLRRRLPAAVRLCLACQTVGGGDWRGARRRAVERWRPQGLRRRGGELVPALMAEERLRLDLGGGAVDVFTDPWRGDAITAWWSGVYSDIDVYDTVPGAALGRLLRWGARRPVAAIAGSGAAQALLRWLAARRPPAPTAAQLAAGCTRLWGFAEDGAGGRASARWRGPHAALLTARLAVWVARRALEGRLRVGFQTPATAFGPDLLDRLTSEIEGLDLVEG